MDDDAEIWSEYFRVKNRLMDYDENLRDSLTNIHMHLTSGYGMSSSLVRTNLLKAQKHIGLILDLASSCGAFPEDIPEDELTLPRNVARGIWSTVSDFDKCQELFRKWYIKTKFYNVTVKIDNRAAIVKKYGRAY